MYHIKHKNILIAFLIIFQLYNSQSQTIIYSQNFDDPSITLPSVIQGNLGTGQGQVLPFDSNFNDLILSSSESSLENNQLVLASSSGFRGIAIAVGDGVHSGAGDYSFGFDLNQFTLTDGLGGGPFEFGTNLDAELVVNIYAIDGFDNDPGGNSDNVLLNSQTGAAVANPNGMATASLVAQDSLTFAEFDNPTEFNVDFTLTNSPQALVFFVGTDSNNGFPNPEIIIDNIFLSTVVIPEPQSVFLIILGSMTLLVRRSRTS